MGLGMIRQLASFIALSIFLTQESWAQEGFVSLECCGQSNYSDPQTTIKWIPDNEFLHTYSRCENITLPVSNDTSQKHLRVFDTDSITQWCYTLPTIKKRNYLIRGTFLHGFALRTSPDISFNVSIGPSTIGEVVSSSDFPVVEAIFKADDENVDFCLVRGDGNPYISMVELRPLSETLYPESNSDAILKLLSRVDVGNKARPIRYPQDRSDRIWTTDTSGRTPVTSADGSNLSSNSTISYVPAEVLETAALNTDRLQFSYSSSDTGKHDYLILLHFFELEPNVTKGQRVFDIYVNRKLMNASFDIQQHANKYKRIVFRVHETNGSLNISLVKAPDSMYGPICNAYEIFQVLKRKLGTQQKDLNAIMEVRNELRRTNPENLLLESWSGDPCLPSTWKGLVCQVKNGITVITKLDLSSSELQGPLPTAISELADLTELNVRNNDFTGSIPESFSSLQHLANLSYGCNRHLKTELPPDLSNQSKITTDKGICIDKSSSSSPISHTSIIGSVLGGSAFFLLIGVIFTCFCRRSQHMDVTKAVMTKNAVFSIPSVDGIVVKPIRIQIFTLKTIESATNQFKTMIGEGGFGAVYRGTLLDGQEVAVKVRSATSTQGTREFENELNLLTTIRHENLIPLLGYCCENDQQILVYPFMSNGSLQDRLYGDASKRKVLDWPTRLSIALGAARGLLYLHTYSGRSIIHRDVKSSNILLDNRMCAKVADFGFSKYAPQEGDSGVSLEVRGTAGYLDPEYYSTQHLSAKSDVFSYGVVLLEIITGREPLNIHRPRNEWSLIEWAKPFLLGSKIEEIVDPSIKSGYHAEAMWRVAEAALLCIEPFSTYRPSIEEIVRELEDALIIENNASEYMKSIESLGGSNRYFSIEKKALAVTTTPTEPSPVPSQPMAAPEPR